tara:strand:+ start:1506 stop:1679 length:174 start_codon:yes stop_codon:yes gene_type:complete
MLTDKEQTQLKDLDEHLATAKAYGFNKDCHSNWGHLAYLIYCENVMLREQLLNKKRA